MMDGLFLLDSGWEFKNASSYFNHKPKKNFEFYIPFNLQKERFTIILNWRVVEIMKDSLLQIEWYVIALHGYHYRNKFSLTQIL